MLWMNHVNKMANAEKGIKRLKGIDIQAVLHYLCGRLMSLGEREALAQEGDR